MLEKHHRAAARRCVHIHQLLQEVFSRLSRSSSEAGSQVYGLAVQTCGRALGFYCGGMSSTDGGTDARVEHYISLQPITLSNTRSVYALLLAAPAESDRRDALSVLSHVPFPFSPQCTSAPTKRSSSACTAACPPSSIWTPLLPSRHCGRPSLTARWPRPSRGTSSSWITSR